LPGIGYKDVLSAVTGADTDDDQSLLLVFFEEFVVVRNGFHAWAAPGGVQIHNDNFAFDVGGSDAAIDPIFDVKRRHGLAFQGSVGGAGRRLVVPGPIIGKFAGGNRQHAGNEQTQGTEKHFRFHVLRGLNTSSAGRQRTMK
jgi:hypothetical protein